MVVVTVVLLLKIIFCKSDTRLRVLLPYSYYNRLKFYVVIAGIVASVLIAIILIVIIVLKYIVFKLDPSYKVTEDKSYQQGASAALLGNQVTRFS